MPSASPPLVAMLPEECGRRVVPDTPIIPLDQNPKIVSGKVTEPGSHPWMVSWRGRGFCACAHTGILACVVWGDMFEIRNSAIKISRKRTTFSKYFSICFIFLLSEVANMIPLILLMPSHRDMNYHQRILQSYQNHNTNRYP